LTRIPEEEDGALGARVTAVLTTKINKIIIVAAGHGKG